MSLVFGVGIEPDLISALSGTRAFATQKRCGDAAPFLARLISFSRNFISHAASLFNEEQSRFANGASLSQVMRIEEIGIRDEFGWVAEVVGLTDTEQAALLGANNEFSA